MRTASRAGARYILAVDRQTLVIVNLAIDSATNLLWHDTRQAIALEFQNFQIGQLCQLGRNGTKEIIAVQPKATEGCDGAKFCWNSSSQCTVGDTERGQFGEFAELGRKGASDSVGVQPQGNCER